MGSGSPSVVFISSTQIMCEVRKRATSIGVFFPYADSHFHWSHDNLQPAVAKRKGCDEAYRWMVRMF